MSGAAAPRVAILGAGLMGRWHAHAARLAGARVAAVLDPDCSRASHLAGRHRDCRVFDNLDAALDAVDVVHVCTPTSTHVPIVTQALRARRHVLVEKPVAPTADDTASLFEVARSQRVLLCPVHQFLFQDGMQAALTECRAIGPLRHIDATVCSAGADEEDDAGRERIALEILPHPLSLLARLLPGPIDGLDWTVRHPAAAEIRAIAETGGISVSMLVSMSGRPTVNRLQLIGALGTMHVDLFHGFAATQPGTVSAVRKLTQPFTWAATLAGVATANLVRRSWRRELAYPGLRRLVERFYDAATIGDDCPIAEAETLAVARACDRLRGALLTTVSVALAFHLGV